MRSRVHIDDYFIVVFVGQYNRYVYPFGFHTLVEYQW